MKTVLQKLLLVLSWSSIISISFAQAGTLDSSFGINGKETVNFSQPGYAHASTTAVQMDGKIVVAGFDDISFFTKDFAIARFRTNGNIDSSFGINGIVTTHFDAAMALDVPTTLIIQPDGKLLAGGTHRIILPPSVHTSSENDLSQGFAGYFAISRYQSNGNLDSTFGINGKLVTYTNNEDGVQLNALALQPDGKILAAGVANGFNVIRYLENGSIDSSFGMNGKLQFASTVYDMALTESGMIYIARVNPYNATTGVDFLLNRLLPDGSIDVSFGNNGEVITNFYNKNDIPASMIILKDNNIVVTGTVIDTLNQSCIGLVKYKENGTPDSSFGLNGKTSARSELRLTSLSPKKLVQQWDGKLIIAGGSGPDYLVARFNSDGSLDSNYSINGKTVLNFGTDSYFSSAALQADGKVVVVGHPFFSLARLKGEEPVTINIKKNISVIEGNATTTPALFKILLNKPTIKDVFVSYSTKDLNAIAGSDYTFTSGTLKIKAGKVSGNVVVLVIGDNIKEKNEKFALILSSPVNAVLGTIDSVTCTIKNDDAAFAAVASSEQILSANPALKLYPNPVKDILRIEGLSNAEKATISIVDATGKIISLGNVSGPTFTYNTNSLPAGVYHIKIEAETYTQSLKFVKE